VPPGGLNGAMTSLRILVARIAALFSGRRLNAELDEELATHLAQAADDHRRRGLSDAEAALAATREFGGVMQTREAYREARGFPLLDTLAQDVRYAIRVLRKSPGFTLAAVFTLALGIGANTAIFTVIDALMLRSLPVRDPDRLVVVGDPGHVHSWSTGTPRTDIFSFPLYRELRDGNAVFSSLVAACRIDNLQILIDGGAEDITGRLVTGNYFETLGVEPSLGRTFTGAEDRAPAADPYVVLSYGYWQRRFGGDPSVVGRAVRLKDYPFTIVGVAPPAFFGEVVGDQPDVWAPMMMEPVLMPGRSLLDAPNTQALLLVGRLKPGVTIAQARANVSAVIRHALTETLSSSLSADDRDAIRRGDVRLEAPVSAGGRGVSRLRAEFSTPLLVLMGIVGLVMVVACVNVANLMLARSAVRRREIAVRLALGAGPRRIVRQLLTEAVVLASIGGALGLLLAQWGAEALVHVANRSATMQPLVLAVDGRVLAFAAVVCIAAGLLFGAAPAIECLRDDLTPSLQDAARSTTHGSGAARTRRALVSAQIAVGLVIVIAAGLLVHSLRNLEHLDLGYRRDQLLLARVDLLPGGYAGARQQAITRELLDRLAAIPGVRRVSASSNGLFSGSESADAIRVQGFAATTRRDLVSNDDGVGPNYFSTIGVPIVRGREITLQDYASGARVAVVNETFARFYFGARDPLGSRLFVEDSAHPDDPGYEIVGVARDVRDHDVRGTVPRRFYLPLTAGGVESPGALNFEIRADGRPDALVEAVRRTIREAGPGLVVDALNPADRLVGNSLVTQTLVARLSLWFGALVLILICVGLYGSMSYGVASRTREIGVRMALGASRATIIRMVTREAAVMLGVGAAIGLPLGMLQTRLFQALLFDVGAVDPASIGAAAAVVILTSAVAAIVPAHRATRIDPTLALRQD